MMLAGGWLPGHSTLRVPQKAIAWNEANDRDRQHLLHDRCRRPERRLRARTAATRAVGPAPDSSRWPSMPTPDGPRPATHRIRHSRDTYTASAATATPTPIAIPRLRARPCDVGRPAGQRSVAAVDCGRFPIEAFDEWLARRRSDSAISAIGAATTTVAALLRHGYAPAAIRGACPGTRSLPRETRDGVPAPVRENARRRGTHERIAANAHPPEGSSPSRRAGAARRGQYVQFSRSAFDGTPFRCIFETPEPRIVSLRTRNRVSCWHPKPPEQ